MGHTPWTAAIATLLLVGAPAWADNVPLPERNGTFSLTGDSPPSTVYTFTGQGGLAHDVVSSGTGGTFTIAGIPAGASVAKAYFITGIWDNEGLATHSMTFTFDGSAYGTVNASTVDPGAGAGLDLGGYIVDVTTDVSGNGSYTFTAAPDQPGTGSFGHLLVVVYSDVGSASRRIILNFGAESIQNGSSTSSFAGIEVGAGTLHVWTQADQAGASEGEESISFNGAVILGGAGADIFNNNEGNYTSYFELAVNTVAGGNTAGITTGEDWFGWHYTALVSTFMPTPVKATTWGRIKARFR